MTLQEIIEYYKKYEEDLINIAIFTDKQGEAYIALIKNNNIMGITIDVYTIYEEKSSYLEIRINACPAKRVYLNNIYCYEKFRGRGLASHMSTLLDFVLKDYNGYIIYGDFVPSQMSSDTETGTMTKEELIKRATEFYKKARYDILSYNEYIEAASSYPYLDPETDFMSCKNDYMRIFKQITPQLEYEYEEVNGILIHKNASKILKPY